MPETPAPSPSTDLMAAIEEGSGVLHRLPKPPRHHSAQHVPTAPYLSASRRRLVGHAPALIPVPQEITVARRNYYSQAQQAMYKDSSNDGLTALAKAAGKKTKTTAAKKKKRAPLPVVEGGRFVTTKHGRVIKLADKKPKKKKHSNKKKHARRSLSQSWPSSGSGSGRGFSSSTFSFPEDAHERQAERAEMERCDRK